MIDDLVGLLCVLSLVAILGGAVMLMLYGVRGLREMVIDWFDRK